MTELSAIKVALGLLHLPSQARLLRSEPIPAGIDNLLRIAAGDAGIQHEAATALDRSPQVIGDAAVFFIEQILMNPASDSYRVLGAASDASAPELRRNMALLLSWLHPDKNLSGQRAVYAARVTGAWDNLRTPDRRAAYDQTQERQSTSFAPATPLGQHAVPSISPAAATVLSVHNPHQTSLPRNTHGFAVSEHNNLLQKGMIILRHVLKNRAAK